MTKAPNTRKVLHVALAAALTVGGWGVVTADSLKEAEELVTGHTQFVSADSEYNSCMAGVAGILMNRVTWFNGRTLFSRPAGQGSWVYVTEHLSDTYLIDGDGYDSETGIQRKDPSREQLYRTGETFEAKVEVAQGETKTWLVHEFFAIRQQLPAGSIPPDGNEDPGGTEKVYIYAVEVSERTFFEPTIGEEYNFALVADTCKWHAGPDERVDDVPSEGPGSHDNRDSPEDQEDPPPTKPRYQHDEKSPEGTHGHGTFAADVWVGGEPNAINASRAPDHSGVNP